MRKIIKASDIEVFFGVGKRQAYNILRKIRSYYKKKKHQPITLNEFAEFFDVPFKDIEEVVLYQDLPDDL